LRISSFGGYGLALVVFGAYDSYPAHTFEQVFAFTVFTRRLAVGPIFGK